MMIHFKFRVILIVATLAANNAFSQIYCPTEESFNGPVIFVKETLSQLPQSVIDNKGVLKTVSHSNYKVRNSFVLEKQITGINGGQGCRCTMSYSNNGLLLEKTTYNSRNEVDTKFINSWNKNRIIRVDRYNQKDQIYSSTVNNIDPLKLLTISKELVDGHEEDFILTELNSSLQPIIIFTLDDELKSRMLISTIAYDSLGRIQQKENWNYNRSKYQRVEYQYDSLDRMINGLQYDSEGNLFGSDSLVYDANSNIIFNRSYNFHINNWTNEFYKYQFDEYGNILVKETWYKIMDDEHMASRIIREYKYKK